jgi:hypothetical protein
MHMKKAIAAALGAAALVLPVVVAGPASAAKSYDPNVTRIANPANACKAIPGTLETFGIHLDDSDFSYSECVQTLARGEAVVDFGVPYEQCAALEAGVETPGGFFQITYPYTFHAEEGDPFPNLMAKNRKQCGSALYAFHTIESYLPPMPE